MIGKFLNISQLVKAIAIVVSTVSIGLPAIAQPIDWLPNPTLTPGAIFPGVTREQVCTPGYAKLVRHVSGKEKALVYREYNVPQEFHAQGEIDHLISLELGGSNDIKNLWFEPYYTTPWNARVKDRLEAVLHAEVCRGQITLQQAQNEISKDWTVAYQKRFGIPH